MLIVLVCLDMAGCAQRRASVSEVINEKAALSKGLPFNPLQWKIVSTSINERDSTMSTLYGNDVALLHARTDPQHLYPAGSVLSLVTWFQQEDDHWFGARIPGQVKSVEFITVDSISNNAPSYSYQLYEGAPLKRVSSDDASSINFRIGYVLDQRASVMP